MQIGNHRLSGNLFLAPMAGITDLPFRQLCRRFGASLAISEMISADTSLWGSRKTQTRLHHEGEDSPVAVQIVGTDTEKLALAARINVDYGAEIIDINMGCPAKKVCKVAAGSALMRDESLVGGHTGSCRRRRRRAREPENAHRLGQAKHQCSHYRENCRGKRHPDAVGAWPHPRLQICG